MVFDRVLVTGAPASGKSTLLGELESQVSPIKVVEFGRLIAVKLRERDHILSHSELRSQSAKVVTANDVASLDHMLASEINAWSRESHVVIASHAVTHESYGVRVTAFSQEALSNLKLSAVVVLQAPAETLLSRVAAKDEGRLWRTANQAERLQSLQSALALIYGVVCGCPVYVFDSDRVLQDLATDVLEALHGDGFLI